MPNCVYPKDKFPPVYRFWQRFPRLRRAQERIFGIFVREFCPISGPSKSKFHASGPRWASRDLPRSIAEPVQRPVAMLRVEKCILSTARVRNIGMNVQITPLQTPPARDDDRDDEPGRGRIYLIGGVAL